MARIIVTGGCGFIGTNLVKKLVELKHDVTVIDNYISGKVENHVEGVKYLKADSGILLGVGTDNFDLCFHLGEYSRIDSSFDECYNVLFYNTINTIKVVEWCYRTKTKIIYGASSTKFADEGVNHSPYSFSKSHNVDLIRNYGKWYNLEYAICYFYNVFGEGYNSSPVTGQQSVVSVFEDLWKKGQPLTVCGDGMQMRRYTYVQDVVNGLIKASDYDSNEEFQFSSFKEFSVLDIAKLFSGNIIFVPSRRGDRLNSNFTNMKASKLLDWKTTVEVDEWIKKIKDER